MNREEILQALSKLNDAIARLNARLHPPPQDAGEQQELETELVAAEQSRETLQQALNNLPAPAPDPSFAAGATPPGASHVAGAGNQPKTKKALR